MAEKRFKPIIDGVEDILTGEKLNNQFEVSLKLNSLNDENEQLKSEIEKLSYANEDLLSEKRNWQRMSDEYCKLSEENEQLKQQLADIDRLIYDLGHDEMRRQYEEIFKGDV